MNPRIGDTVHYYPHFTDDQRCLAALVIDTSDEGADISVAVWSRTGDTYTAYPPQDPDAITVKTANGATVIEKYTPGTWHHIH